MINFGADDFYPPSFLVLNYLGCTVYFRDNRLSLGYSGFKKLFDPGQAAGNIESNHTASVEGAQGKLGAWFTDTFGSDDTHGHIRANEVSTGKVAAIAALAGSPPRLTFERRPDVDRGKSRSDNFFDFLFVNFLILFDDNFVGLRMNYIAHRQAPRYALKKWGQQSFFF